VFRTEVIKRADFAPPQAAMEAAEQKFDWPRPPAATLDDGGVRMLRLVPLLFEQRCFVSIGGFPAGGSPDVMIYAVCHGQ
jgi:hypothetical protein